ncbi:MAG: hypothetical protein RLN69_07525 [Woeseiaceae bacterium]
MAVTVSILALFVLVAVLIWLRRKSELSGERPLPVRPSAAGKTSAFHAVSIRLGPNACLAAQEMAGKRFLSGAAPRIPLPECDNLECKCRFVHHKDRRAGDERRSPFGQGFTGATGTHPKEQRQSEDRRSENSDDDF